MKAIMRMTDKMFEADDATMTRKDFIECSLRHPDFVELMRSCNFPRGFEVAHLHLIFDESNEGTVDKDEFINGMFRLVFNDVSQHACTILLGISQLKHEIKAHVEDELERLCTHFFGRTSVEHQQRHDSLSALEEERGISAPKIVPWIPMKPGIELPAMETRVPLNKHVADLDDQSDVKARLLASMSRASWASDGSFTNHTPRAKSRMTWNEGDHGRFTNHTPRDTSHMTWNEGDHGRFTNHTPRATSHMIDESKCPIGMKEIMDMEYLCMDHMDIQVGESSKRHAEAMTMHSELKGMLEQIKAQLSKTAEVTQLQASGVNTELVKFRHEFSESQRAIQDRIAMVSRETTCTSTVGEASPTTELPSLCAVEARFSVAYSPHAARYSQPQAMPCPERGPAVPAHPNLDLHGSV